MGIRDFTWANISGATTQPNATAGKVARFVRAIPFALSILTFVKAHDEKWPWWSSLVLAPIALWYFVAAVEQRALLKRFTTNELDLKYMMVAPAPMPPDEALQYGFDPPTNCFTVMFVLINESPRQVTLRSQLALHSVRGVAMEYPQASAYLRWPFPDLSIERTIKPKRDGRIDVAVVAADARKIRFLGPKNSVYMSLDLIDGATEVSGLIDIEAMDRDADVRQVSFSILVNRADPVALSVVQIT